MMSEHDKAIRDLRHDAIMEVAESMPGASAKDTMAAIVTRLGRGLPVLVEVEVSATGDKL